MMMAKSFSTCTPPTTIDDAQKLLDELTGRDHTKEKVRDPITGELDHPLVNEPDPHWQEIVRLNEARVANGHKALKLSAKMLKGCFCDCMGKSRTHKCADEKWYAFESMLALHKKSRELWHQDDAGGVCGCGRNQAGMKEWCASADSSLTCSMCPAEPVPEFALPTFHEKTCELLEVEWVPKLHPLACHEGKCDACGWNKAFAGCPTKTVVIGAHSQEINACAVDTANKMMSWHSWQRIPNSLPPTNDDNDPDHVPPSSAKVSCSTHWFPVSGTRAEFMLAVKAAFVECREHMFWVKWHRIHEKRVTSRFIIEPAALGKDGVKPWQLHTIVMYSDFAATIKLPRSAEATGSFEQTSQMFVSVMTHDGRLMRVDDLPPGTLKARLKKEGVQAYPCADTTVLCAMSNANNDTDFCGSALAQALEVVHTGKAPEGSKMEFVHDGVRLAGSDTSRPLAHGLKDWGDTMPPTAPFVKCGHAGQSFVQLGSDGKSFKDIVEMPSGSRTGVIEFRDGCKAQFQGRHAFLVHSLFERITGVKFSNVCSGWFVARGVAGCQVTGTSGSERWERVEGFVWDGGCKAASANATAHRKDGAEVRHKSLVLLRRACGRQRLRRFQSK